MHSLVMSPCSCDLIAMSLVFLLIGAWFLDSELLIFLNQARAQAKAMRLVSGNCFGLHVGMPVCLPPRALITSGMI